MQLAVKKGWKFVTRFVTQLAKHLWQYVTWQKLNKVSTFHCFKDVRRPCWKSDGTLANLGSNQITIKVDSTRCHLPHLKSTSNQPQVYSEQPYCQRKLLFQVSIQKYRHCTTLLLTFLKNPGSCSRHTLRMSFSVSLLLGEVLCIILCLVHCLTLCTCMVLDPHLRRGVDRVLQSCCNLSLSNSMTVQDHRNTETDRLRNDVVIFVDQHLTNGARWAFV